MGYLIQRLKMLKQHILVTNEFITETNLKNVAIKNAFFSLIRTKLAIFQQLTANLCLLTSDRKIKICDFLKLTQHSLNQSYEFVCI